jgi:hypothetical protein
MDRKTSAAFSLAIILIIAIFIGGVLWWSNYKETKSALTQKNQESVGNITMDQKNTASQVPKPENAKVGEADLDQAFTYISEKLGFSVEISKAWEKKYKVLETPNSAAEGFEGQGGYVSFQLPTADPKWTAAGSNYFEVLSLVAYPISKLDNFKKECKATGNESLTCVAVKNPIGKNNNYVFSYVKSNNMADYPKDFTEEDLSRADSALATFRATEVEKVNSEGWKLISGNALDNCSKPTYSGESTIHGWYEWDYVYVEKDWVLKIAAVDQQKLPVYYYDENGKAQYAEGARLVDVTPELIKKLKAASKNNPVELTVKGFSAYCEGAPSVSIAPGSQAFK